MTTLHPIGRHDASRQAETPTVLAACRRLVQAAAAPARRRAIYWRTVDQMTALEPRLVKDCFGIGTWEIESFARRAVEEALPADEDVGRAFGGLVAAIRAVWRTMRRRRSDTQALLTLDDRMLADIGLSRTEILHGVARPWENLTEAAALATGWPAPSVAEFASIGGATPPDLAQQPTVVRLPRRSANDDRLPKAS